MAKTGHVDTFARDNLPPRAQWPEFKFDLPELQYPERLNCVTAMGRPLGRGRAGRPSMSLLARGNADLRAAPRAREPHRQRAHPRSRPRAGQSRAAARAEQSDDGCGLFRRHQGRRRRGRDHAAAPRQGAVLSARQGEDRAGAVRRAAGRRDGEGQGAVGRIAARRLLGQRRARRARDADDEARLRQIHRLRHRRGRRLPDRVHLRHHRRAEGHDALPPRHAGDLRLLRQACAARRADRPLHRLAAARLHLRARRPRAVSAPHRRLHRAAGEGRAGRTARRHREVQDHHPVHRADRLSRHARQAQGPRHLVAAQMRVGRRDAAEGDLRRLACRDRHQDPRRHRRDRNAAHLHRLARARGARRLDRKAGAGLRGAHPRRRRQ